LWSIKHTIVKGRGSCLHFPNCIASMDNSTGGYVTMNKQCDRRAEAPL